MWRFSDRFHRIQINVRLIRKKSFADSKNNNKRGRGLWGILVHCDGGLSGLCVWPNSEKSDTLEPKLSARAFMGLFGRTRWASHLKLLRDMQVLVCLCAQIISRPPLVWNFTEHQRQDVSSENTMYVCFGTPIWHWTPIAHGFAFF